MQDVQTNEIEAGQSEEQAGVGWWQSDRATWLVAAEVGLAAVFGLAGFVVKAAVWPLVGLNGLVLLGQLARLGWGWDWNGRRWERWLALGASLLLLAGGLIGLANSYEWEEGSAVWSRQLAGLTVFLALWHWLRQGGREARRTRLGWLGRGMALAGLGLSLIGIFTTHWNTKLYQLSLYEKLPHVNLLGNINANVLAGALVVGLPLPVAWLIGARSWWARGVALLSLLSELAALFLTQSRTAWVAGGVGLGLFGLLAVLGLWLGRRPYRRVIGWLLAGLGLVAVAGVGGLVATGTLKRLTDRADIWGGDWQLLGQFGLSGVGLGNFGRSLPFFFPYFLDNGGTASEALYADYADHVFNTHAHNLFFQVWLDLGLIGLVGLLVWVGWLGWRWWRLVSGRPFSREEVFSYGWACAGVIFLLQSQADAALWTSRGGFMDWPVLAALAALPSGSERAWKWRLRGRWVAVGLAVVALALVGLNWGSLENLLGRNEANLALQQAVLGQGGLKEADPQLYRDTSTIYVRDFYDLTQVQPDRTRLDQARHAYGQALAARPDDVSSLRLLGVTQGLLGDKAAAYQAFDEALVRQPGNRYAAFQGGLIAARLDDFDQAVGYWRQGTGSNLYPLARALAGELQSQEAATIGRELELSLRAGPSGLAYSRRAALEQAQNQPEKAVGDWQAALRYEPDNLTYQYQLINLELGLGRKTEAAALARQAIELARRNDPTAVKTFEDLRARAET